MTKEELFALMKGTIIVSCQATPGEPLYDKERSVMPLMARAAKQAGAKMIRTSSVRDIVGIKEETGLPVIGLIKREYPGYTGRITMTMREVDECMEALSDIISIDCTDCTRGDGLTAPEFLKQAEMPGCYALSKDSLTASRHSTTAVLGSAICPLGRACPGLTALR